MKDLFHCCFTSHDEVLFRNPEDVGIFLNLLALHGYRDNVDILVDAEMSNHIHNSIYSEKPQEFMWKLRISYSRLFNKKYSRHGPLGAPGCFIKRLVGRNHACSTLSYVGRNGLHHGLAPTAFGYEFCSANALFAEERGIVVTPSLTSRADIMSAIPRRYDFPDNYVMDENGVFLRTSFLATRMAESYYGTARNYLFQMNRPTGEEWLNEQLRDKEPAPPIRLTDLEPLDSLEILLKNETGKGYRANRLTDMDVCILIDKEFLPSYGASSVYLLSETQKGHIYKDLSMGMRLPDSQVRRCLVL